MLDRDYIVQAMQDCKAKAAIGICAIRVSITNREVLLPIEKHFQLILSKLEDCQRKRLLPCPQRSLQGLEGLLILQISYSYVFK